MKDYSRARVLLKNKLLDIGLRFFITLDEYNIWCSNELDNSMLPNIIKRKFFNYLNKNSKIYSYKLPHNFYDLIAAHDILLKIILSSKSNDILHYGITVIKNLNSNSNILDFGCNVGYLSSFYSNIFKNSTITGYDKSKKSVARAIKLFHKKKYANLNFTYKTKDLGHKSYDFITDTQCLCTLKSKELINVIDLVFSKLKDGGLLISISNLQNEKIAKNFLKAFKDKGFFPRKINPIILKTLNGVEAYSEIIFQKKYINKNIDLNLYYENIRKKISIVNLSNLI